MQVRQSKIIRKTTLYIIYGAIFSLLSGVILPFAGESAFADTNTTDFNISLNPSMSMEISSSVLTASLNPSSHAYDTNNLLITLGTNYINGYNLYILSDSTDLTNSDYGSSNKYYINTLENTATGTSTDFPANYWGYRISSSDSGGYNGIISTTEFFPFASNTLISSANTATSSKNVTLTFATKIDYEKPAGLYTNTFTFNAIINPATYAITYTDNAGDTIANMPSPNPATGMISSGSATISSTVPTRDGYTFKAWCDGTVSDSGTTCAGTEYSAGANYPITTTVGPDVTIELYAVWTRNIVTIATATNMQDVFSKADGGCPDTLTTGQAYGLKDSRDDQTYYVARLADGNCWMLQNLKLGKSTTSLALTTADSDVPSGGFTLNGKLSDGKFTYSTVSGTDYQNNSSQYYCTDAYGCYYNWYTATAGAGQTSVSSGDVGYSICPKGWTLPTGGSNGQFNTLYTKYNSASAMLVNPTSATENTNGASAPGFLLGGRYNSSGADDVGSYGYYWSRTAFSAQNAYSLVLNTSSVNPADHYNKYRGMAVRCVLK